MSPLVTYLIGCIGLIIKPGPDLLCTISTALSHGRARACCLMAGLVVGCWIWILLLALGAAAFLEAHPLVMSAIRYGGMAYIGYLAVGCLAEAWNGFHAPKGFVLASPHEHGLRLVARGILMSMGNPLTIMFFLAFLPHFTSRASPPSTRRPDPAARNSLLRARPLHLPADHPRRRRLQDSPRAESPLRPDHQARFRTAARGRRRPARTRLAARSRASVHPVAQKRDLPLDPSIMTL